MRISKTQARENHQFVVMKAADLFRERGFELSLRQRFDESGRFHAWRLLQSFRV